MCIREFFECGKRFLGQSRYYFYCCKEGAEENRSHEHTRYRADKTAEKAMLLCFSRKKPCKQGKPYQRYKLQKCKYYYKNYGEDHRSYEPEYKLLRLGGGEKNAFQRVFKRGVQKLCYLFREHPHEPSSYQKRSNGRDDKLRKAHKSLCHTALKPDKEADKHDKSFNCKEKRIDCHCKNLLKMYLQLYYTI